MMDDDYSDDSDDLIDDENDEQDEHDDPDEDDPEDSDGSSDDSSFAEEDDDFEDGAYEGYDDTVFDADATFDCAFCGETNGIEVDFTAGQTQSYVEDCQVCCRPNLLSVEFDDDGQAEVVAEAEV